MGPLPIVELDQHPPLSGHDPRGRDRFAPVVHVVRLAVLIALVVGLHRHVVASRMAQRSDDLVEILRGNLMLFPNVTTWQADDQPNGLVHGIDERGQALVTVASSSPAADHVIGYSGPTRLLLCLNEDQVVTEVKVLESFDTREHLAKVQRDRQFWRQFVGLRWGDKELPPFDGVSGATLTSLAIAESVATCVHAASADEKPLLRQSLKFPNELNGKELNAWISLTHAPVAETSSVDEVGRLIVQSDPSIIAMRTGRLTDEISGYQGPTEMLWLFDDSRLIDVRLRSSFDNEPYVGYVKQERSFWKKFKGRPLVELAKLDREAEMIDGVSGATMTSIAVADTIRQAATRWLELQNKVAGRTEKEASATMVESTRNQRWNVSLNEIMTAILALSVVVWSGSSLRGRKRARQLWQLVSFVVLALLSGNLLSLALAGGWTSGGPAYRLAPGLTILAVISLWMAAVHKRNVYCDHLCPHGILQQWIRPRSSQRRFRVLSSLSKLLRTRWVALGLSFVAWGSIGLGLWSLLAASAVHLAWLEPFDAYLIGFGFSVSGLVWLVSIAASTIQPMVYCRHACPTGKVLGYIRRSRSSGTLQYPDVIACLLCAWVWIT